MPLPKATQHLGHSGVGQHPDLVLLTEQRIDRHPLVQIMPVGVPRTHRPVVQLGSQRPSSRASVTNIAWDQSSGVATGPQRRVHSAMCSGR